MLECDAVAMLAERIDRANRDGRRDQAVCLAGDFHGVLAKMPRPGPDDVGAILRAALNEAPP